MAAKDIDFPKSEKNNSHYQPAEKIGRISALADADHSRNGKREKNQIELQQTFIAEPAI